LSNPDSYVRLRGVTRDFEQGGTTLHALADVSADVAAGDRIAVIGPSGSGKSTLLHLMAGLDAPTGGALSWPALGPRQTLRPKNVAHVSQTPTLLPTLSVIENVALPLLLASVPVAEAVAEARVMLERFELVDLADKLPEELSGGQAQRIGFARALATRPRLVLADEPTGYLDRATAIHFLECVLGMLDQTSALVVATHDPMVAERMRSSWPMDHGTLRTGP
jgi:putative ABC transport system ATP-binding protein